MTIGNLYAVDRGQVFVKKQLERAGNRIRTGDFDLGKVAEHLMYSTVSATCALQSPVRCDEIRGAKTLRDKVVAYGEQTKQENAEFRSSAPYAYPEITVLSA